MEIGWKLGKGLMFLLLLVIFLVPLAIITTVPGMLFLMMLGVAAGCASWYAVGRLTPGFTLWYLRIHKKFLRRAGGGRKVIALTNRKGWEEGRLDVFYRALSESFFPTVIAFSVIGFILSDAGDLFSGRVFLVLLFAPVLVSITVPIRILNDSKLYYIDADSKEVITLGHEFNIRLKSIGGVLAFFIFLFTLYTLLQDITGVIENLVVYFSFIYPTITITAFIYYERWHREFTVDTSREPVRHGLPTMTVGLLR